MGHLAFPLLHHHQQILLDRGNLFFASSAVICLPGHFGVHTCTLVFQSGHFWISPRSRSRVNQITNINRAEI